MAVLSKTGITNSQTIQASHITQSIDALTGQVTDYDITISGSLTLTGSFRIANGAITSSGAISSSAGLFGTTLRTSGAITSSGAISSSAGLLGTTLTATDNATVGGTLGVTGATTLTGALTASIISASSNITASSILANNYRTLVSASFINSGSRNVDASVTGSVYWVGNLVGGGNNIITASMPLDGLSLDVYLRNTGNGSSSFALAGSLSSNGSSPFLISGSNNGSAARTQITLTAFSGSAFIQFRRIGNDIIAGIC
jgi:hypothetical protein